MHFIGFAADGFPIKVYTGATIPRVSYKLKTGVRADGPGGRYDGTFVEDYTYHEGAGDLDACNGQFVNGAYEYVLTTQFPFIPRCFSAQPDGSFRKALGQGRMQRPEHGRGDFRRPPPPRF